MALSRRPLPSVFCSWGPYRDAGSGVKPVSRSAGMWQVWLGGYVCQTASGAAVWGDWRHQHDNSDTIMMTVIIPLII